MSKRYPLYFPILLATFCGFLFPVSSILFMLWHDNQPLTWNTIIALHRVHYDLIIIWTAPLVLGLFGNFIGKFIALAKQQGDSLERRTAQLNTILDAAASAIITISKTGQVLSFNKAAEHIFGFNADEIIGKNVNLLMPSAIAMEHDAYLQRYLNDTASPRIIGKRREVEGQRKNGEVFPVLLRVNAVNMDGEPVFCGLIDDISETKLLQNQLGQAQKLEAIGQLASGIAHEINTPIQYIGDNLSALLDNFADISAYLQATDQLADPALKPQLDELADKYDLNFILEDSPKAIKQAQDGVERVAEIVKAMKSFSHVEQNQDKQTVNLHEALNSALTISRNSYKYIAEVETDFAADVGPIECYANELNQVFLNLIINAAHAIEEKQAGMGLIRVITRNLGDSVEVMIQDNGAGIAAAIQEKVFNLFFTTKAVGKGTGQGLSLAHSIVVEKHQGKLFFESSPERGTTFHIQLPVKLDA
ncbi:MAG: PAS domain S-box protein [Methylobacter sp.]|nr:PAS domain S-box protein [Methylobacter sp.]MDP2428083.1 PAS domain S-box protein [Methylobacter sp.]MDP3055122.1 PAS domain S-box protein [Methylobacter sp.]MDP3360882.1 PAS domain S-box protein [Methylobacter sp.]MDZ4217666.1 PAS domain S-box protein [Methylobacter sp.]